MIMVLEVVGFGQRGNNNGDDFVDADSLKLVMRGKGLQSSRTTYIIATTAFLTTK